MRKSLKWLWIPALFGACSVSSDGPDGPPRGSVGKADLAGSCEGACGEASKGGCFCDDECVAFGDCCEDKAQWCEAPVPADDRPAFRMHSPISLDVIVASLEDQVGTLAAGLATAEATKIVEALQADALEDQAAIVVSAFASPLPDTFCKANTCRETYLTLEAFRIGQDNEAVGLLVIRDFADPDRPNEVRLDTDAPPPVGMNTIASPISLNVFSDSMTDQLTALRDAMGSPQVVEQVKSLTDSLAEESAVPVVAAFDSPLPGSFCRDDACRDTNLLVERFAIGAKNVPVGVLQVRNFADPNRPDDAKVVP